MLNHTQQIRRRNIILLVIAVLMASAAAYVWVSRASTPVAALDNLSGEEVLMMVLAQHTEQDDVVCAEEESSDFAAETRHHGLSNSAAPPAEIKRALAHRNASIDDHEHRHFENHRVLLVSWDSTSVDLGEGYGQELGSVFELHYLKDGEGYFWDIAYTASVHECPPE